VKLFALGPGSSLNHYKEEINKLPKAGKVLAFQNVFPNCIEYFDLVPDFWVSGDPNAYMEGFEFLLDRVQEKEKFANMQILIPEFFTKGAPHYRKYCGTTPLLRIPGAWKRFEFMLSEIQKSYDVKIFKCTTTKYIKTHNVDVELFNNENLFGPEAYYRFMHHEPIFGTIEFDSESVIGTRFKWGLENKLSSIVFPVSYFLKTKELYIAGFDFIGPRFYSSDARHPWTDETQSTNVAEFPLSIIKKWLQWNRLHDIKIYSIVEEHFTLLNSVLPYREITNVL